MLLPARTAVLNYLYSAKESSVDEIMQALKKDYGHERQFKESLYLEHVMALEANGLACLESYKLKKDGNLSLIYSITDDGRDAVEKYVSKKFR